MNLLNAKPNGGHCEDTFEFKHSVNCPTPMEDGNLNEPTSEPGSNLWWLTMFLRKAESVEIAKEQTGTNRPPGDSYSAITSRGVQSAEVDTFYQKVTEHSHSSIQDKATQKAIRRWNKLTFGKPERQLETSTPPVVS